MTKDELARMVTEAQTIEDLEKVSAAIDQLPDKESSLESQYLDQVYKGFEKLGYLAKPITILTTPITEAVRSIPKYIAENVGENTSQTPPIDTAAEFRTLTPSDRAGTSLLMQDVNNAFGIENKPILDIQSEEFPKAAAMINNLSMPANIAGVTTDIVAGSKLPAPSLEVFNEIPLPKALSKESMVQKYLRATSKNKPLYQEMQESGKIKDLEQMVGANTNKYIQPFNKEGVLDVLDGPVIPVLNEETGLISNVRQTKKGDLGKLGAQQDMIIEEIPRGSYEVDMVDMANSAKQKLAQKGLDSNQVATAERIIDDVIKTMDFDQSKIDKINKVNQAQLDIDKISNEIATQAVSSVKNLKQRNSLQEFVDQNIDPTMTSVDKYKQMIQDRNMGTMGDMNRIRKRGNVYMSEFSPLENPLDIKARHHAGSILESTASDNLAYGLSELPSDKVALYNETNKELSNKIALRDLMSKQRSATSSGAPIPQGGIIRGTVRSAINMMDEYGLPYAHRASDAMKRAGVTYGAQGAKMSGVNLQAYLIPRSSEQILAEQDLVADKLLKELGPKGVVMFQEAIKNPKMLPTILQQMELVKPEMFQADEYGRFDGTIFDPILKQKAIEQIINNQPSSIEGAKQMQLLINGNKYYGG